MHIYAVYRGYVPGVSDEHEFMTSFECEHASVGALQLHTNQRALFEQVHLQVDLRVVLQIKDRDVNSVQRVHFGPHRDRPALLAAAACVFLT